MIQPIQPPKPIYQDIRSKPMTLEEALGEHNKLNQIKQRMNATYEKPQQERKKAFSSNGITIDI